MDNLTVEQMLAEMLPNVTALNELTDEQNTALVNVVKEVTNKKTSAIYKGIDSDILAVTGKEKPGTVKTYDFLKNVLSEYKTGFDSIETLKAEKAELEEKIKDGKGDEAMKQKLADTENRLNELQSKYEADKIEWEKKVKSKEQKLFGLEVDYTFQGALSNIKRKPFELIDEQTQNDSITAAKTRILSKFEPRKDENNKTVWVDKVTGLTVNNPEKGMSPFTTEDLIRREIPGLIDNGKQQTGAGTKGGAGSGGATSFTTDAKTQVDFMRGLDRHLMELGIAKTSPDYLTKVKEAKEAANFSQLPLQ